MVRRRVDSEGERGEWVNRLSEVCVTSPDLPVSHSSLLFHLDWKSARPSVYNDCIDIRGAMEAWRWIAIKSS